MGIGAMTGDEALKWRKSWSGRDRMLIQGEFDRLGVKTVVATKGYLKCINHDGTVVMRIHPGGVEFVRGFQPLDMPADRPWLGRGLSTGRPYQPVDPEQASELTLAQALSWRENWSYTDRQLIESDLERLGVVRHIVPTSGTHVKCCDHSGKAVMRIYPGYVEFLRGHEPDRLTGQNWPGYTLSIFQPRGETRQNAPLSQQFCPVHGYPLLPSGGCDQCE